MVNHYANIIATWHMTFFQYDHNFKDSFSLKFKRLNLPIKKIHAIFASYIDN
jgi:hypothetical protein